MSSHKLTPFYSTALGHAYLGDSLEVLPTLADESVNLSMTSPPYALHFKKEYGNVDQGRYIEWFLAFARQFHRVLKDNGSLVIDIGGAWRPGQPTRSLYHFELLIALCRDCGYHLTDKGDVVLDPFAGSNTTGEVSEAEGRHWIAIECNEEYLETSRFRFEQGSTMNGGIVLPTPVHNRRYKSKRASANGTEQAELFP